MKYLSTILLFLSLGAQASECAQEAKKYCSGVEPGKGQLARCLSDYQDSLSPKCVAELKEFKQNTGKKNPCFEELAEFCSDLPSDPQNYEYCLLRHESKLGQKCAADFKGKKGKIITRNVCAQDIASTCYKELSGPEGAVNKCLIKNKSKLAGFCQKNIDKRIAEMRKRNPCYDDTEKFCPTQVKFIDIQECLEKKIPQLNPLCKKLVEKEKRKASANPCYKDLLRHCKQGISPSEQHRCLTVNETELSNACRQFRQKEDNKVKKMVELCEADRVKHCSKEPFQDGKVLKCLMKNKSKLSKPCAELL